MTQPVTRRARLAQRRAGMRRFYLHTLASTVLPGAGLFGTRAKRLAWILLAGLVLTIAFVLYRFGVSGIRETVLSLGLNSDGLLIIALVLAGGGLLWILGIILTSRLTRPRQPGPIDRWWVRLFTAFCVIAVALPVAYGVQLVAVQRDLLSSVFGSNVRASSNDGPKSNSEDPWENIPRVNVMLVGADSGKGRRGVRSDSMMVASIDTKTGDTVLVGLPRNLQRVPFAPDDPLYAKYPNGFYCTNAEGINTDCLLNGIWTEAEANSDLYPDDPHPGYTETRRTLGYITGLDIDYGVLINLSGFADLVDAMGGVDVTVNQRLCVNCKSDGAGGVIWTNSDQRWIEPGFQHLDGYDALWFARSRAQSDDFSRMRRQRCLVGAMIDQSSPVDLVRNYPALAKAFKKNVDIDIPQAELPAWAELAQRVQKGTITSVTITDQVVDTVNPDYEKIRQLVSEAIDPVEPSPSDSPTSSSKSKKSKKSSSSSSSSSSTSSDPNGSSTSGSTTGANDEPTNIKAAC